MKTKETNYPKQILLKSRYPNVCNKLIKVDEKVYKLETSGYNSLRVITAPNDINTILAIDPCGGPLLEVGDMLEGLAINRIWHDSRVRGFVIELV